MFDLEIEAALREGDGEISLPLVQISFCSQSLAAIKSKMAVIILAKKILSTRLPIYACFAG